MPISENKLEEILTQQADRVAKESDERMQHYIGALKEDFDDKLDAVMEYVKDIPQIKEDVGALKQDVGILKTDVKVLKKDVNILQKDVKVFQKDVAEMKPLLNATFEKVGEIAVDMEIVKEASQNHERRLQKIEAR